MKFDFRENQYLFHTKYFTLFPVNEKVNQTQTLCKACSKTHFAKFFITKCSRKDSFDFSTVQRYKF